MGACCSKPKVKDDLPDKPISSSDDNPKFLEEGSLPKGGSSRRSLKDLGVSRPLPKVPEDIVVDHILTRLPVAALQRLRSASKSWNELISHDRRFVELHLAKSRENPVILATGFPAVALNQDSAPVTLPINDAKLLRKGLRLRSSCDGLICMESSPSEEPMCIVNLALRRFKRLPAHSYAHLRPNVCQILRSPNSGAYKVLLVCNLAGRSYTEICTLDFNCSWRKVEFSFKTREDKTPYIALPVVDGAVHWINSSPGKDSDVSIIAFDIDTEKYKMITGPKACGGKVHCKLSHVVHLMEFRGELQLMHICTGTSEVSIWSMKDGEWSKLYTLGAEVAPKEMKELTFRHWPYYYPIAWIGNETLFWASDPNVDNHYLVFYNHQLRRFRNFDKKGVFTHRISAVFPYVDSLVFPDKLPLSKFVSFRK